jgi:hypothetical protein
MDHTASAAQSHPTPRHARKPRRCHADYRWTASKVIAFLDALAESGRVDEAAAAVGMGRQSAYRLRRRLAGTRFDAAFDGARRTGIRKRMAASIERLRSRWDGPGLEVFLHGADRSQGDIPAAQSDTPTAQVDTKTPQGDADRGKAT